MPPLKTYIFQNISNSVEIIIKSYDFESAYFQLIKTTKNPADFKCMSV